MTDDETSTSSTWRALRDAAARWVAPLGHSPRALRDASAGRRRHVIYERWRRAVQEAGLTERMYLPGGVHRIEPKITRVFLGRSERFTIRLGAGQTYDDVEAVRAAIAKAFEVPGVRLTELSDDLVEIELEPAAPTAGSTTPSTPAPRPTAVRAAA